MIGNITRLLVFLAYLAIAAGLLYLIVVLLNRGVQLMARGLGFEVGDFFQWLKKGWRRLRKPRRRVMSAGRIPVREIADICDQVLLASDETDWEDWKVKVRRVRTWLENVGDKNGS